MKAAVVSGSGVRVTDIPEPDISDGEILVRMRVSGVCGTDLYKLRAGTAPKGVVLGHEVAGVVARSMASHLAEGDRVFVPHHIPCGTCKSCSRDNPTMCSEFKKNCMDPGGFAELIRVLEPSASSGVKKIPDSASFIMGSLIEPLGCCVRSVERSGMQPGDSVLVVGAGQVGSYHILTALALGAGKVIACDISKERLKAAQKIGAHSIINASVGDPIDQVFDECSGGVDVAFVTSESPQAVATAVSAIREGGTVVLFAHGDGSATFDVNWILKGERTITASYSSTPGNHEKALELMLGGKLRVDCIKTVSFALEEADEAVEAARTGKALRVVLEQTL